MYCLPFCSLSAGIKRPKDDESVNHVKELEDWEVNTACKTFCPSQSALLDVPEERSATSSRS